MLDGVARLATTGQSAQGRRAARHACRDQPGRAASDRISAHGPIDLAAASAEREFGARAANRTVHVARARAAQPREAPGACQRGTFTRDGAAVVVGPRP
jgi:hypothetical protein